MVMEVSIHKVFKLNKREERDLCRILDPLREHVKVQEMKKYIQHGNITTYDHCESVARGAFKINRFFHMHADENAMVRAAFLHDFYLYDWHIPEEGRKLHGYHHADIACDNAVKFFNISKKEQEIIKCHMWPLNLTRLPRCRESMIVTLADKIISLRETLFCRGTA